jgi:hypothetical protein
MQNSTATKFQLKLEVFPKDSGDLNIVCSAIYAEYKTYITIVEALTMPQAFIRRQLEELLSFLDDATYDTLIKGLGTLNVALEEIMPTPFKKNMKLDAGVGVMGELLALTCTDFLHSLPEELYNIFRDIKTGINKMSASLMPGNIMAGIAKSLLKLKDDALKEMFGSVFETVLQPLIVYDAFLQDNGINDIIGRMKRIERCMTKPGICNRNRRDFLHPDTNKLYSTHFKEIFMLSSKGTINIRSFGGGAKKQSQLSNVIKSLNSFRVSIT